MKKALIAAAVAAALPAFAQAQTNVQLYGIADLSVGVADAGGSTGGTEMVVLSGVQSTSRFGIRGSEDLGRGLKGVFNFEAGIAADTGVSDTAGLFQRRSVVGVEGAWGTLLLGRDYTPGFSAAGVTDVMGYAFFGNWLNFTAGATQGTSDRRYRRHPDARQQRHPLQEPAVRQPEVHGLHLVDRVQPVLGWPDVRRDVRCR